MLHYKCTSWYSRRYVMEQFWSWLTSFEKQLREICGFGVEDWMHRQRNFQFCIDLWSSILWHICWKR
jgi:hypothetical protein